MYVLEAAKLAFLPMPRTASKTTGRALIAIGGKKCGQHHAIRYEPHPKEEWIDWLAPGWKAFTNIRSPFDACASWHVRECRRGKPPLTPDWIRSLLGREYYFPVPGRWWGMYAGQAEILLRFEDLDAQLLELCGAELPKPRVWPRNRKHYRDLIGPKARAFIEETFAAELEEYGYEW